MKGRVGKLGVLVMVIGLGLASPVFADWYDGFEDGLTNWTIASGSTPPDSAGYGTVTSYTVGSFTIDPHSGSYMAVQKQSLTATTDKYWIERTSGFAEGGDQGTLTAYVNIASSVTLPASSLLVGAYDDASGKNLWLAFDRNNPKLYYRGSAYGSAVYTSIDVSTRNWHKVEFVISDSGTSLYVDDVFIVTDASMTKIDRTSLGATYWGSSPFPGVLSDDVSFVSSIPEPATMSLLLGVGAFMALRRRARR